MKATSRVFSAFLIVVALESAACSSGRKPRVAVDRAPTSSTISPTTTVAPTTTAPPNRPSDNALKYLQALATNDAEREKAAISFADQGSPAFNYATFEARAASVLATTSTSGDE